MKTRQARNWDNYRNETDQNRQPVNSQNEEKLTLLLNYIISKFSTLSVDLENRHKILLTGIIHHWRVLHSYAASKPWSLCYGQSFCHLLLNCLIPRVTVWTTDLTSMGGFKCWVNQSELFVLKDWDFPGLTDLKTTI